MKKKKTLNCKEAKFTQELSIYNNECINNTFEYSLRRASTTKKFFDLLDEQLSNQLLYNTEEKEAYFLNSDRRLFKLKFEPIDIKNKPDILKEEETQRLLIQHLEDILERGDETEILSIQRTLKMIKPKKKFLGLF